MNDITFAACMVISSQLIFSLLMTSWSVDEEVAGRIASPDVAKPRI